ncbi:RAG1 [Mytilus coruscus]|uniref:RAG1 n=1 Tax=Mytilus coruscus TaxID=42192 RepID=A0A6J8EQU0_MYTCO|nr:RAG1 [Mytilus coruscus]
METTEHLSKLEGFCRVCGKRISSKQVSCSYKKIGFKEELQNLYNIDVENESDEVYPPYICRICTRDLYRFRNLFKQPNTSPNQHDQLKYKLFVFIPHSEEDCFICNNGKVKIKYQFLKRKRTSTCIADEHDEDFPIEQLKDLVKGISQMNVQKKEDIFKEMIKEMPLTDVEILSYCLGKKIQQDIADDAASFAVQYKDLKSMAEFQITPWLKERNKSLICYLYGICNLDCPTNSQECGKELAIARGLEQLYLLRCPNLISPLSFLLNVCIYSLTGSKLAIDMIGNCCPAGHYKTVTNWLKEQGTEEPVIPVGDIMNIFDNEQVIGRKSAIRPNQKVSVSIITNKGIVSLKSDMMLQKQLELKPKPANMMDEKYQKEDSRTQQEQHVLKTVTDEILSQSSERFIKLEKSHFEQLYYFY